MNLKKILEQIENYKSFLKSEKGNRYLYVWESLEFFQKNWNTESDDLLEMYDRSLNNSTSRRLWVKEDFYPKKMMKEFIKMEPEYVRLAFRDLFNDNKSLAGRVDRFVFYCDELLKIYFEKNKKARENDHYHNHAVAMMYLTFRFPEKHTLYHFKSFNNFLKYVGAKDISSTHDLERFSKITKTINTFLLKDEELIELLQSRLEPQHYKESNFLSVYEFLKVANKNM